jgi:hypothetical protein
MDCHPRPALRVRTDIRRRAARLALLGLVTLHGCDAPATGPAGDTLPSLAAASGGAAPAAITAPHGGPIEAIAITDRGDAVLTADAFGELRLWPTVDGSREPVVVRGPRPNQLALGRDGEGLFAAILDQADNVTLLRFDRAGAVRERAQLPSSSAIEQVVAIPGGVLVRRADHTVERFDSRGTPTGRLVPAPGQRVVSLAARRSLAIAGLSGTSDTSDTLSDHARIVRWIDLGPRLAWGAAIELLWPLDRLALSPSGRRIAGLGLDDVGDLNVGTIFALNTPPGATPGEPPTQIAELTLPRRHASARESGPLTLARTPVIGFFDDANAVLSTPAELTWITERGSRWAELHRDHTSDGEMAIADRVVGSRVAMLTLLDRHSDHVLGYRFVGQHDANGPVPFQAGHGLVLGTAGGPLWLDRELRAHPASMTPDLRDLNLALGDRHVLRLPSSTTKDSYRRVVIRDVASGVETEIDIVEEVPRASYDPGTRVLAIATQDKVRRYRLTFDPVAAQPLRTLAHVGQGHVYLTDPARASGVVAVIGDPYEPNAFVYRMDAHGETAADRRLQPDRREVGAGAMADRAGSIYVRAHDGLRVYRDGRHGAEPIPGQVHLSAVSHDGTLLAAGQGHTVTVFDAHGAERWRRVVWGAGAVAWSYDDRTLFVTATGGAALSFDARTGERLAVRCGWGFGLYDEAAIVRVSAPSACSAL